MAFLGKSIRCLIRTIPQLPRTIACERQIHRWVRPTLIRMKKRENKQGGKIINPRNTFLEWNLESEIYAFGKRLNEEFDQALLFQAFTDRSYVIKEETKQREVGLEFNLKDNRELAQEGEEFMQSYILRYLEIVLPRFPSDGIKSVLEHLMSEAVLAHVSSHLGTKDIVLTSDYPATDAVLSNTLKAIVGALIQSLSEERAAHFVRDFVVTQLQGKDVNEYWNIEEPLGLLEEMLREKIEPRLIGEVGSNTVLACYRVGLYVNKEMLSSGFGEDIPTAKEMAAREALKRIFGTAEHMPPINFQLEGTLKDKQKQVSSN